MSINILSKTADIWKLLNGYGSIIKKKTKKTLIVINNKLQWYLYYCISIMNAEVRK